MADWRNRHPVPFTLYMDNFLVVERPGTPLVLSLKGKLPCCGDSIMCPVVVLVTIVSGSGIRRLAKAAWKVYL